MNTSAFGGLGGLLRGRWGGWLLAWLLLAGARPGRAAAGPPPAPRYETPAPDSAAGRTLRQPAAAARRLAALRSERAFDYREPDATAPPRGSSWLARLWWHFLDWLGRSWRALTSPLRGNSPLGRYLLYGFLAAAVVFVILKLLQVDLTGVFGRTPRRVALPYDATPENIHELDLPDLLGQAEASGNYRLAARLGYLTLLKQLSDASLIDWQPDKTNDAYLRELGARRPALRPPVAEATRQFEYVWYGELPLGARLYEQVRQTQLAAGQALGRPVLAGARG